MSPKKQGTNPSEGGVIPDEAVEDLTSDAHEAASTEEAAEGQAAAGARTPEPGQQADAEVAERAERAREAREKAEAEPAPKAAGGAGSKKADAAKDEGGEEPSPRSARRRAAETTTPSSAPTRRRRDPEEAVSVRAQAKYVRCAPRKARLVIDHIRGKSVGDARAILLTTPRAASRDVLKLLDSCVANAENNHELSADELTVEKAYVDEGPTLKRYQPRALGRATPIRKRTSHMTIHLTNQGRR
jgi:ribosomal protein L22